MKENTTVTSETQAQELEAKTVSTVQADDRDDDFLAGAQAADPESFNVCISCD